MRLERIVEALTTDLFPIFPISIKIRNSAGALSGKRGVKANVRTLSDKVRKGRSDQRYQPLQ